MKNTGIMGGTFDPIHNGHLLLGRQAHEEYDLGSVWYMPSGQPPHKASQTVSSAEDRLEMVRLATEDVPYFYCSDFEINRPGLTYSSDTLTLLKEEEKDTRFFFIVGADSFYEIESWHEPQKVLSLCTLLVARREYDREESVSEEYERMEEFREYLDKKYKADIRFLHCSELPISSHEIRARIAEGEDVSGLLPDAVIEYIKEKGLYVKD